MTQRVTRADERQWHMDDSDHSMTRSRDKRVRLLLGVEPGTEGQLRIRIIEIGKRERRTAVNLQYDTAQSLLEWLNEYVKPPAVQVTPLKDVSPPLQPASKA